MSMEDHKTTVEPNSKSVAWYWAIEYFSTLKQIDASILRGLIELAPEIHDEELSAKTREAVALRCLEELFDPLPDTATVDAQANGHFDFSRSCEEVLKYTLRRASISQLKSGAPESLKNRAIPFIIHKRASMGQSSLSKLKDELVRGALPYAASLSKRSRLVLAKEHDDNVPALPTSGPSVANADAQVSEVQEPLMDANLDNVDGNADAQVPEIQDSLIAKTLNNVDGNPDAQVSMVQEGLIATTQNNVDGDADVQVSKAQESLFYTSFDHANCNADAQASKAQEKFCTSLDDANGKSDAQEAEAQLSFPAAILENMDGARGDDMHAKEFFPLKRKSNDFPDKYVDGQAHEIENQGDLDGRYDHYLVSKKFHLDPSCSNQSLVQTLVCLNDNIDEFGQEKFSGIVSKASKVRKYSKLGGLEESRSLETGHDERLGFVRDINGNSDLRPNQSETANDTDEVSRGASANGNPDFLSVPVVDDTDLRVSSVASAFKAHNVDGGKIHTNSDLHENEPANTTEHLSKDDSKFDNDGNENERLRVSEKEGNIFDFPCKVNRGSSQASVLHYGSVLNLCVKCNKEGSLLFCSSSNCSLGIHESCLGSLVKFDDIGNFYCPFCAYSRALSEYRKCMESVSLAKKELHSFFNTISSHRPTEHAKKL